MPTMECISPLSAILSYGMFGVLLLTSVPVAEDNLEQE